MFHKRRYSGRIGGVGAKIAVATLAAGALAIAAFAPADQAARPLPARIKLEPMRQLALLEAGRVTARVRLRRGARVRASAALRLRGGRRVVLGTLRSVRLASRRSRRVTVPLSRSGRAALAACPVGRVVVTIRERGSRRARSAGRGLALDPPDCVSFFAPTSFWNSPLPNDAPEDPASAAITAELVRRVEDGIASNLPPTINTTAYTPPIYTVGSRQARTRVRLDRPPGLAPELEQAFASVPLPADATPAYGSDGELVLWQPATDTLWEFWLLRRASDGWHASWGGRMEDVSTGPAVFGPPHPNWGTAASGLPLAGGLITPRDLRTGRIDHALAMAVPMVRAGEFARPAQRTDGRSTCPAAVPEGARFRLDPSVDVDALGLPRPAAVLARAAQRYGIIVRDQSGSVAFYAQNALSLGADPYPALFEGRAPADLLKGFPWSRLKLVRMELVKQPGPGPPPVQGILQRCG